MRNLNVYEQIINEKVVAFIQDYQYFEKSEAKVKTSQFSWVS